MDAASIFGAACGLGALVGSGATLAMVSRWGGRIETKVESLVSGQAVMNTHLDKLNGRTGKHAVGIGRLATEISRLPCRDGGKAWSLDDCDAAASDED